MKLKGFLSGLLILAYTFALVMSTGHLSEWYRLTLGSLPGWFAVGLAAALEMSAFLLSLLSNSLLKGSRWASWGAVVALGLVWVGNWFSMRRAGEGVPEVEVFLSSLFVPVSTYVVAKVLGELLEAREALPVHKEAPAERAKPASWEPKEVQPGKAEGNGEARPFPKGEWRYRYLNLLDNPKTARELIETLGLAKPTVYKQLKQLQAEGLVRYTDGKWVRVRE